MSEQKKRRATNPDDYNRAQPTREDLTIVEAFVSRETSRSADHPIEQVVTNRAYLERKLGLLVAMYFNSGFDAGVASVREENGYQQGYADALIWAQTEAETRLELLRKGAPRARKEEMEKKVEASSAPGEPELDRGERERLPNRDDDWSRVEEG